MFIRFHFVDLRELRLIIKADVQGSLEPIMNSVNELAKGDIAINILYAETGNIVDNDVMLAAASKAIIIGFNVQPESSARRLAEAEGGSMREYDIIYRLTEDIDKALKGMLEPEEKEVLIGRAEVRALFRITKVGHIAGCRVMNGELRRNAYIRVLRAGQEVHSGQIASLKPLQEDVREVRAGYECGVSLKGFDYYQVGDILECYIIEKVAVV